MSIVQNTYPETHGDYVDGQNANTQNCDVDSLVVADGSDDIPFGRAIQRESSGPRDVSLGASYEQAGILNGALTDNAASLTLDAVPDGGPLEHGTLILIDSEIIRVGIASAANLTYAITRGQLGTAAAAHVDDSVVLRLDRNRIRGIALMDERIRAENGLVFKEGDIIPGIWRGDVAVKVSAAVAVGQRVVAATQASGAGNALETKGQLSAKAPDATHVPLLGATWVKGAAAQGIAIVRINTTLA